MVTRGCLYVNSSSLTGCSWNHHSQIQWAVYQGHMRPKECKNLKYQGFPQHQADTRYEGDMKQVRMLIIHIQQELQKRILRKKVLKRNMSYQNEKAHQVQSRYTNKSMPKTYHSGPAWLQRKRKNLKATRNKITHKTTMMWMTANLSFTTLDATCQSRGIAKPLNTESTDFVQNDCSD